MDRRYTRWSVFPFLSHLHFFILSLFVLSSTNFSSQNKQRSFRFTCIRQGKNRRACVIRFNRYQLLTYPLFFLFVCLYRNFGRLDYTLVYRLVIYRFRHSLQTVRILQRKLNKKKKKNQVHLVYCFFNSFLSNVHLIRTTN